MLYPEDPGNLNRVKDNPEHVFFKKYGESMPPGAWNHPGTKQGIYMIGPNAEYLEGRFAASGDAGDIRARLSRALQRWETLRKEKNYANSPVPTVKSALPPGIRGELILRVNVRDLPRGAGDRSGARFDEVTGNREFFPDYVKWAWNENWIGLPSASTFVPSGTASEAVSSDAVSRIAQEVLVDNVRGQVPTWQASEVKQATITMRRLSQSGSLMQIEYSGSVQLGTARRGYDAKMYGRGEWDTAKKSFNSLELVFTGMRRGAAQFNRRENDPGPAPMGITLVLHRP
ncbi:MAG: hypothetical protein KF784_04360 [Fimbriimonadaceae bacterium]|nr:hypothetical protein [Fimbriimonadaceae bacterium]